VSVSSFCVECMMSVTSCFKTLSTRFGFMSSLLSKVCSKVWIFFRGSGLSKRLHYLFFFPPIKYFGVFSALLSKLYKSDIFSEEVCLCIRCKNSLAFWCRRRSLAWTRAAWHAGFVLNR
jgi:hypothetical protein